MEKHTIISTMGLWGQGDELALEVTVRQGHRELRRNVLIQLTKEQLGIIEEIAQGAWLLFELEAVDLRVQGRLNLPDRFRPPEFDVIDEHVTRWNEQDATRAPKG